MAADYKTLYELVKRFIEWTDMQEQQGIGFGIIGERLRSDAREATKPITPKNDVTVLHRIPEDAGCCASVMHRMARAGLLDRTNTLTCTKCSTVWSRSTIDGGVYDWTPQSDIEVLSVRE